MTGTLTPRPHSAKFSTEVVVALGKLVEGELAGFPAARRLQLLDPFAGVGKIHQLASTRVQTVGVELEPEWACAHPDTIVGNALALPDEWTDRFDIVATSCTYGNRFADTYDGKGGCRKCNRTGQIDGTRCDRCGGTGVDQSKRYSYRIDLGRMPSPGSSCTMRWGDEYRAFHVKAWAEAWRVLRPPTDRLDGGALLLNVSNHMKGKEVRPVVEWHRAALEDQGFVVERTLTIGTKRMRNGANWEARVDAERIIVARRPR